MAAAAVDARTQTSSNMTPMQLLRLAVHDPRPESRALSRGITEGATHVLKHVEDNITGPMTMDPPSSPDPRPAPRQSTWHNRLRPSTAPLFGGSIQYLLLVVVVVVLLLNLPQPAALHAHLHPRCVALSSMMQKSGWRLCRSSVPMGTTQPLEVVAMHDRNPCTAHDHLRTFDFWMGINNPYVRAVVRSYGLCWGGAFSRRLWGI